MVDVAGVQAQALIQLHEDVLVLPLERLYLVHERLNFHISRLDEELAALLRESELLNLFSLRHLLGLHLCGLLLKISYLLLPLRELELSLTCSLLIITALKLQLLDFLDQPQVL